MFKYGIVSDIKPGFAKVNFIDDDFVSDWLPVLVRKSLKDKESWQLEINEHVICLLDEHCDEGVILGAIASDKDAPDPGEGAGKFSKKFEDGTTIVYDKKAHKLTVDVKGSIDAKATGDIEAATPQNLKASAAKATVEAADIELTGNVTITGDLTVTGPAVMAAVSAAGLSMQPGGKLTAEGGALEADVDITTTGQVTGSDVKAGTVSLKTHTHTAPSGGGPTSAPLP